MEHGFVSLDGSDIGTSIDWLSIDSPRMQKLFDTMEIPLPEVLLMVQPRKMKLEGYLCRECGFLGLKLNSKVNEGININTMGFPVRLQ
jgi:hypothetical protein